jgi:ABC-2 type transport system ATP-binding protein
VRRDVGILPEREDPPSFLTPSGAPPFVAEVRDVASAADRIDRWAADLAFEGTLETLATNLSEPAPAGDAGGGVPARPGARVRRRATRQPRSDHAKEVKWMLAEYAHRGSPLFLSTHHVDVAA